MTKKKKKKKNKKAGDVKIIPVDMLLEKANLALKIGNFRDAINFFNKLLKLDGDEYLPGLIQAYKGLSHAYIENDHHKKAKIALARIEKISGLEIFCADKIIIKMADGDFSGASELALSWLSSGEPCSKEDMQIIVDGLVLGFQEAEVPDIPDQKITSGLRTVLSAFQFIACEDYNKAVDSLRKIGIRSMFCYWKLYLKGLVSYYTGDDAKALKAFNGLPAGSIPARSADAYLALLGGCEKLENYCKDVDLLKNICLLVDEKSLVDVLPRAEYLWRVGRFRDSYRHVVDNLNDFPTEEHGIANTLSTFYYNSIQHMEDEHAYKFLGFLLEKVYHKKIKNRTEAILVYRADYLYTDKDYFPDYELVEIFEKFMSEYKRTYGDNSCIGSIIYTHLGDMFSFEEPRDEDFFGMFQPSYTKKSVLRNEKLAEEYYSKALKMDQHDRDLHFNLMSLYEKTGDKSKAHRKIDEIIKLFPNDKDALVKAGTDCIDRNSFQKAMKYLEQAITLDPLDNQVKKFYQMACMKGAIKFARKSKVIECRNLLPKAIEHGVSKSSDYNLGHTYLYACWAVFELLNGDKTESERLMSLALKDIGNDLEPVYFTLLFSKFYDLPKNYTSEWENRINSEFRQNVTIEKAILFCRVLLPFLDNKKTVPIEKELKRVNAYALKAVKLEYSREKAVEITEFALSFYNMDFNLAQKFTEKELKKNPDDALFRLNGFKANFTKHMHDPMGRKDLDEMSDILSLAEKERDSKLIAEIRSAMDMLEKKFSLLNDINSFYDPDDDEFYNPYIDDFDSDFPSDILEESPERFFEELEDDISPFPNSGRKEGKRKNKKPNKNKQLNLFS